MQERQVLLRLDRRPVIGHRGNAAFAPENTIESFRQAVALGADALELDVHLSADGEVVVIHDATLDRTTDRSGRVDRLTWREIRDADAGARFTGDDGRSFPYRGLGLGVPTLTEVLRTFPDTPVIVEIKSPGAAAATRTVLEQEDAVERCVVASFEADAYPPFRGSPVPIGSGHRPGAALLVRAWLGLPLTTVEFQVICMPTRYHGLRLPIAGFCRILAPHGVPVHVWTIDDPAEARRLWNDGVCGIITNTPDRLLAERRAAFGR